MLLASSVFVRGRHCRSGITTNIAETSIACSQASRTVTQAASARPVWFPGNKRPEHLVSILGLSCRAPRL